MMWSSIMYSSGFEMTEESSGGFGGGGGGGQGGQLKYQRHNPFAYIVL